MAIEIGFVKGKIGGAVCLLPATPLDEIEMTKLGDKEVYKTTFTKMRNWLFHKRFFAMLNFVFDNMDDESKDRHNVHSVGQLLIWLKLKLGLYEAWVSPEGEVMYVPGSISFAAMDQDEFREFYKRTVDMIFAFLLPSDQRHFESVVMNMVNFDVR